MKRYFVAGIHTGVGKTVASAILCRALNADYWKPIQAGNSEGTDSEYVAGLINNPNCKIHPEIYLLPHPVSPDASARKSGISIDTSKIVVPNTDRNLVIEGAGGLMVPLNESSLFIDIIPRFNAEVILISRFYLGSINHTLLSVEALRSRNILVKGLIFVGESPDSQESILRFSGLPVLGQIPETNELNAEFIRQQALSLKSAL